jgi:hypothetical protein
MSYTGNKVFNIYINSANRSSIDKSYDFNINQYEFRSYDNKIERKNQMNMMNKLIFNNSIINKHLKHNKYLFNEWI